MREGKTLIALSLLVACTLFAGAFGTLQVAGPAQAAPLPAPTANGDWVFEDGDFSSNNHETITIDGNMTLSNANVRLENKTLEVGGYIDIAADSLLELVSCDVTFDGDEAGTNYINAIGIFNAYGTLLESNGLYPFYFQFWQASAGELFQTTVRKANSVVVLSDQVGIENCTIRDCQEDGIQCFGGLPTIRNNNIGANQGWGIHSRGADMPAYYATLNTFSVGGSQNAAGRMLQEARGRVNATTPSGASLSLVTVTIDGGIGALGTTDASGHTIDTDMIVYEISNAGQTTEPEYTINASWSNGARTFYTERAFTVADEANPMEIPLEVDVGPDLVVSQSDIVLSNVRPKEGSVLSIEVTVHNDWGRAVQDVEVHLSGSPYTIDRTFTIASIPANGMAKAYFNWTVSTYNSGGAMTITATVDPDSTWEWSGSNRTNNEASTAIDVREKPDNTTTYGMIAAGASLAVIVVLLVLYLWNKKRKPESEYAPPAAGTTTQNEPEIEDSKPQ